MHNPYLTPMYPAPAPMNPYGNGPIANARMRMDVQQMHMAQMQLMQAQTQYWQQQTMGPIAPLNSVLGIRY